MLNSWDFIDLYYRTVIEVIIKEIFILKDKIEKVNFFDIFMKAEYQKSLDIYEKLLNEKFKYWNNMVEEELLSYNKWVNVNQVK